MKSLFLAAAILAGSVSATLASDLIKVETGKSVAEAADALEAAVAKAGATVFARVDHAAGAANTGTTIPDSQLLVFGNPKLGTPAIQADPLAGLFLPLKVLVYEDAAGKVWLVYEDPAETMDDLNIPADAEVIGRMQGALRNLTGAAAG